MEGLEGDVRTTHWLRTPAGDAVWTHLLALGMHKSYVLKAREREGRLRGRGARSHLSCSRLQVTDAEVVAHDPVTLERRKQLVQVTTVCHAARSLLLAPLFPCLRVASHRGRSEG